ncbi:MAG: electron transport complex subunit RsxC [Lachnospira sp.]|jgi:electron transport complex protein RnfC|uniref:Ion-translocating oxidoreductase complex subunit C n=1 Tax=Lachnospira pectinoschiza TaxID=28052 RepID=A0A1G9VAG1_9FIRM|nr:MULTISPECIES: electron transport complex subunit RsxC [Lachnospira]MCR5515993.1 electron transport complex subunit RsxC [Lachnospira sp.]SDM69073.1 electron transport complex protein RnfC [Lachnospira pectinoschiza]
MGKCTFKGGIHPFDGKELSKDKPIKELFPALGEMVFPLSQHIGAPAKPLVNKGDYVLAGQLIAEAGGFVSANIHSSVSGTVKAIEPRTLATGGKCNSIIIENDGEYKEIEYKESKFEDLTREEILDKIKAAGVVGMGGAGFPTNVKLSPKNPENIDYIIINGAECEPYLTSDYRRLLEEGDKVVMGLKIALKLFDHAKGIIAIEDNKPEAIKKMKKLVESEADIEVKELKTKYPQGGERSLIYATTKREINSSMLPADAGCIVHNVDTAFSIYLAVIEGKPLTKRICTVTGDGVKNPGNFYVWLGTNYRQLLEAAGGPVGEPEKYISGGPMMGFSMYSLDVPVVKGSSSLLVFEEDIVSKIDASACIRCGRCAEGCPEHLLPTKLAEFASRNDEEGFTKFDGMECVMCGSCSYVCPAKRPLTQQIKSMRMRVLANRRKK